MTTTDATRSEAVFDDFKPAYSPAQALAEANRCLYCEDAPCIQACPTEIAIPEFIRKIATGNLKGSARTIFESNILGMSCARVCPVETLCAGDCVYNHLDSPPIQIGRLQRYATDAAFDAGWRFFEAGPATGFSVGLIGAGPASLACAHELRRLGHGVTIYEKRAVHGGLNATGVAPYKMRADRAQQEVDWILGIGGIELRRGELGRDLDLATLQSAHDAVFFGAGLGADRLMDVPGADRPEVCGAVDWIERMKLGQVDVSGVATAVVVGGGNTAIDAVRELLGLGVPEVVMVYRGQESGMSGYRHEWVEAKKKGARGLWGALPVAFEGDPLTVVCQRLDADKRPIEGARVAQRADLVLVAIGQGKLGGLLRDAGVEVQGGRVIVDADGATSRPGLYAGGDAANGGKEVVNAAAEGKRAARAIDRTLANKGAK